MGRVFLVMSALVAFAALSHADSFDHYTNPILGKIDKAKEAQAVKRVTAEQMVEHARALPSITGCFLVVRTGDGRMAKLLVQPGRQRIDDKRTVPILMIDRFVTYREGEERAIQVQGQNIRLFENFRFSLDIGQVVPDTVPADLRFVTDGDKVYVEPVGKAELYLVTKHLPGVTPKKPAKLEVGSTFEARYFNGKYKLYDDGRRSGILQLKVAENGDVEGHYYSDKDGQKYEVSGKVGSPLYSIQFRITFPRTIQYFQGFLFTGDGKAITGSSKLQERETGFYAVRVED